MEEPIIVERQGRVVVVSLNRPAARNALNTEIMWAMAEKLSPLDRDPDVGCFVLKGSDKAFAAGADIKEMSDKSFAEMFGEDFFAAWDRFASLRTPKIAAVAGYALGGGCELAMMCDIIYASETAMFGQPEIKLGVMPGMGGSQRLTKLVGKSKAMDLILTGRMMDAAEAERCGLVSRVFPPEKLMDEALAAAQTIAGYGKAATIAAREAVDRALEGGLREGILFERRLFHALFATADQKEGMAAFVEKRSPNFQGK
ncbi:enoyl-CoA hydratase [Sinorhizobium sp. BG8]|uniref:enoyl-CoA hydratase n=1 Tax=Sinorhizobium sp. BG8 TaxID=2613773 RepID=UPI00193E2DBD|nr:enoyl-CoA hydratase [Sinorhizobium sp. BG8]QRM57513.1 enoyl-CoA hydratase [Sinorhizobium sp. BG8]